MIVTRTILTAERRIALSAALSAMLLIGLPGGTRTALGYGTITGDTLTNPSGVSNLIANPNDFWSWGATLATDPINITYSFAPSFPSDARIRDQIRLAFDEWDTANVTADGTIYSYNRASAYQPFGDIRSITVHEIGHVLGLHHPDEADLLGRNFTPDAGGIIAAADQGNEVMRSWINPGDYNHILSHDELDGFRYIHNADLNFTEVARGGDITLTSAADPDPSVWARGGPTGVYRTGSSLGGVRSTSGEITFNTDSALVMGFQTLGINWDYQNPSGAPTSSFEIRTRGTNNPTPLFRFDGFAAERFNNYSAAAIDADNKDDLLHTWSDPTGGPFGGLVHVGLEQDVWDWTVVSAQVVNPDGTRTDAPLLSFHDWTETVAGVSADAASSDDGIRMLVPFPDILGRGARIINSLGTPNLLLDIGFADADKLDLQLADLNHETLDALARAGQLDMIDDFQPVQLKEGEQLLLLFDGIAPNFPGRVISVDRPDLAGGEVFLFAKTQMGEAIVGTYGLLGRGPIVLVPEPVTQWLAIFVVGWLCCARSAVNTGRRR